MVAPFPLTPALSLGERERAKAAPRRRSGDWRGVSLALDGCYGGAATPPYQKGGQTTDRVQVIDWEQPANNDFLLVSQFSVTGALYTCRPDLVGFVNGLPLVVIELKKPGVPARAAFDENLMRYSQQIPAYRVET